jgi:periplasmic divalent cation tolerance protein
MSLRFIYVTCENRSEALKIAKKVITDRLAACGNILGDTTSVYRWNDEIQVEQEVVLILKTRSELVEQLIAAINTLHSYECPCVVSLPIEDGNKTFLDWIARETQCEII